jgi:hypothetical protein
VDWEPLFPKLPVQVRRYVEGKLGENMTIAEKREEALAKAKENASGFLAERQSKEATELTNKANEHLKNLEWTAEVAIPATATPEQKAALEAQNAYARNAIKTVKEYLSDRSPRRHAELAIGTLIAHRLNGEVQTLQTKITAQDKAHAAALEAVTKERDAARAELDAIKKSSMPRNPGATTVTSPRPTKGNYDSRSGSEALDALAAEEVAAKM